MFCVRILSKPSHTHKFHANAKYQLARTKAEPVCTMWRMSESAVVTNGGEPYAKRWRLRQPESTIWPHVWVHGTCGQVGLCCPAATRCAYLSCEQPKELSALTDLCLIFVLAYGLGSCWRLGSPLLHLLVSLFCQPTSSYRPRWVRNRGSGYHCVSASFCSGKQRPFGGTRGKGKRERLLPQS